MTSLYPVKDYSTNTTDVVHSFAKEWVKMGHEVVVFFNENKFPFPFYFLPKRIKKIIENKVGVRIPEIHQRRPIKYQLDGVDVFRIPILKYIPFGKFSSRQIYIQTNRIIEICNNRGFEPELILGHWENPQILILKKLKKKYKSKSAIVFHGINYINKYKDFQKSLKYFDKIGFRSLPMKKEFEGKNGPWDNLFLCYSGLPAELLSYEKSKIDLKFSVPVTSFIYVGLLIERKYPNLILPALLKSKVKENFTFDIIGEGGLKKRIIEDSILYRTTNRVKFHHKKSREQVLTILESVQCLIMISRDEAFGLVYLEAMSRGCIVIASHSEGMEGVIVDGVNGFLCKSGDLSDLIYKIDTVSNMSNEALIEISKNAFDTANELTDAKVARDYLNNVKN